MTSSAGIVSSPRVRTWTSVPERDERLGELAHVARQAALDDRRVLPGEDQDAAHGSSSGATRRGRRELAHVRGRRRVPTSSASSSAARWPSMRSQRVGPGERARLQERPVAGLQREQLAHRALGHAGARARRRAARRRAGPARCAATCGPDHVHSVGGCPHVVGASSPSGHGAVGDVLERVVEVDERQRRVARRPATNAVEERRPLVPVVAEELGVEGQRAQPAAGDALARSASAKSAASARACASARARVVDRAVVGPRLVVARGAVVLVAVGGARRVAAGPQTRSISSRSIGTSSGPGGAAQRRRGGARRRGRRRRSARRTPRGRRPPRAAGRATARARTPAARSRRASRRRSARGGSATPVWSWSRTPASVASSGRIACVALLVQAACGRERARAGRRRAPRAARARRAYCAGGALELGGEVLARRPRGRPSTSSACDAGRTSRRNAAQRSSAPGAASWSQSTGVSDSVSGAPSSSSAEQRQVARRDRLPQPLLAERPRPEALDVGHVGVQDERDAARSSRSRRGSTARKSSAPSRSRARRRRASAKSRVGDRRREAVVERLRDAAAARGPRPSRSRSIATSCARSLRAWNRPSSSTAPKCSLAAARGTPAARYSCTCHGLPERSAPSGASVRTFGVET